jgi:hypothetical protein
MSREYITIYEFENALENFDGCPYCGSRELIVEGAVKILTSSVFRRDENGVERVKEELDGKEWEVVYYVGCAKCNADLSEYFDL